MAIAPDANLGSSAPSGGAANVILTTSAAAASSSLILFTVGWFSGTATLTGFTTTLTVAIDKQLKNGNVNLALCSAQAPAGFATSSTVQANFSASPGGRSISGFSFTGLLSSAPLDATASASGTGTSWTSGAVTTTNANDLVVGLGVDDESTNTTTSTPNGGWTEAQDFNNGANGDSWSLVYQIVAATGSYTPGGTWASIVSNTNTGVAAAYMAAAAGGGTPRAFSAIPFIGGGL